MHGAHAFLTALAIVLGVAAVTTVVFQRLRQPVVLGYLIAGLLVGPKVPFPLVADASIVETLSEAGVILLMFSLGLGFSLRALIRVGPTAGLTAVVETSLMMWLAYMTGRAFGWTERESVFAGAIFAMSSSTICAKALDERGVGGRLRDFVLGVLVVEDLVAIVLMAALTAIGTAGGVSASELASTVAKLGAFLVGVVVVGLLVVPRAVRFVIRLGRPETTLVASVGFCFGVALLAQTCGYSVALGAFLAGSLVAESGEAEQVERLVTPVRDLFAAVFFVSVGMLIDPALALEHWPAIAVFAALVVAGKIVSVSLGAFLTGNGTRTSVAAGMSLAQIGEFSFILAGLGISLGATRGFLYPVAVAVSAVTTLTTPWLIRASGPVASWVDRRSPRAVQTFAALYGSWVESLRAAPQKASLRAKVRRTLLLLLADAVWLAAILVGTSRAMSDAAAPVASAAGMSETVTRAAMLAVGAALSAPFVIGFVRLARKLGTTLAEAAFPAAPGEKADLAAAPRRALVVSLQLAAVLLVGAPFVAVTQPLLPGTYSQAIVLAVLVVVLGVAFWRSAANLHGHVRAGAQVLTELLAKQSRPTAAPSLPDLHSLLPGMGDPVSLTLAPDSAAVGKTLAELDLRAVTGATVVAILRGGEHVIVPSARERLAAGDVLAIAGTHEAVAAARAALSAAADSRPG